MNPKCITDLNVKHKIVNLLENNIGGNLYDFGYFDDFLE